MAGYRPQANLPFVAVYLAEARGFFADEGLDVEIRHSAQGEHLQLLLAGEVDFTTGTAAQSLRQRANGLPVRAVALFGQRGDQGFVVHADSGIEAPADFEGRSVGFKGGVVPAELLALLATADLGPDDVRLQAVGFDERVFIEGEVDVFPVFLNNEPNRIRNAGVDIRVFDPADYGIATLGITYLAHEDTTTERRALTERFLRAALRGAAYAASRPDEAIDVVLTYADGAGPRTPALPPRRRPHQRRARRRHGARHARAVGGAAGGADRVRRSVQRPGRRRGGVRPLVHRHAVRRRGQAAVTARERPVSAA